MVILHILYRKFYFHFKYKRKVTSRKKKYRHGLKSAVIRVFGDWNTNLLHLFFPSIF
jgi:hypothetical protein